LDKKSIILQILGILLGATSCATKQLPPLALPEPLRPPAHVQELSSAVTTSQQVRTEPQTRFQTTPAPPPITSQSVQLSETAFLPRFITTAPLSVNIEGLPLPAFINEIFGNLLKLSFDMLPQIQQRADLVTLRISEPQQPVQLYDLARQVLVNYGVGIQKLQGDDFIRFVPVDAQQTTLPSLVISGMALPNVPPTHRPIFQFIPLKAVNQGQIVPWIQKIYQGHKIEILADAERNTLMLLGMPQLVSNVTEIIKILDQPMLRGQHSVRIEPAFIPAATLATQLTEVLKNHGYAIGTGSVNLLPLPEANALIVFAIDPKILLFIQQWATELDRLNPQLVDKPGLFFYAVRNTAAEPLAGIINSLLQDIVSGVTMQPPAAPVIAQSSVAPTPAAPAATPVLPPPANLPITTTKVLPRLSVDKYRNGLLFIGTGEEWSRLLPVLQSMDKPAKQVLIEATVAEITLSEKEEYGIEWVIHNAGLGGLDGTLSTLGLGAGGAGLTYTLSNAGQVRAVLNAFASNSRATILQTPRLLVRSGSSATITVGSEIPTLTSQASSNIQQGGDSAILQQIQYRSTGISLNITPIVYAGRRVDLKISQQVSESQPNESSSINSPIIFNRQIQTELTLNDGYSVLLGGIISNSRSQGQSRVPILSDIPILGRLFRTDRASNARTELIVMIIPYVIEDEDESKALNDAMKNRLELLPALGISVTPTPVNTQEKP